jgi:hypothetical protein
MNINFLAVAVAVIASFIVGALWYSPVLFGKLWMHLTGTTQIEMKNSTNVKRAYTVNIIGTIITALAIAVIFDYADIKTPFEVLSAVLILWVGISMPFSFNDVIFGKKPIKLWALNGGHHLITLLVMGYIIALWH